MPDGARVAVIGAGIIGASVAWRLAQKGARVVLFEAGRFGAQASQAGAGMLAPGGEVERGGWFSCLLVESLKEYPEYVAELTAISGVPIDYRRSGAFEVARSRHEWQALQDRASRQRALGIVSNQIREHDLPPEIRGPSAGALYYPDDGLVNSGEVMAALRRACERTQVEIREQAPVEAFDRLGAGFDAAVVAAGASSSRLRITGVDLPPVKPVKGHLIGYEMAPGSLPWIVRQGHTYVLQRAGGFTILGSTEEDMGFDTRVDPASVNELAARGAELVELPVHPERVWTGLRPAMVAGEPAIGRAGETRVWLAYGHFRNGILAAPATARRIANEIIAAS